jgi:archaellum biogenesis ATPase FlaH
MAVKETNVETQKYYLDFFLSSGELFTRAQNIFNPENFDRSLKGAATFIQEYTQKYSAIPSVEQVLVKTGTNLTLIDNIQESAENFLLDDFEQFTKKAELTRAIVKSVDLLDKDDFGSVEKLIKDAVQISLTRDLGINYFEDPKARLLKLKDSNGQVSTGWTEIDRFIFGGFNRGELEIFCGGPGSGKSVVLQNLACNWISKGMNGIYITLELSQELVAMRIDSMITGISSKEIFRKLDDVELKVAIAGKKSGRLKIKFLPSGSTVNDIRAYVKELMIQENYKPDFICVDYLDLINPNSKIDLGDFFVKDKLVSEGLRNFGIELKAVIASASQLNRSSFDEIDFNLGNVAGGISKANSCDNMFGIYTSRIMKERGLIQLQMLKTRNSSGVGNKVDLDFNVDSLRITDATGGQPSESAMTGTNILAQIKNAPKSTPQVTSMGDKKDLLKTLMAQINKSNS